MNSLAIKIFAAAVLTLTALGAAPASAGLSRNGWSNGWRNGWQNGWQNGVATGLNATADGHALRVTGIEFPAE